MATQKQAEANRINARKSTGPRTSEGKEASRRNALRHGMAGDGPVVAEAIEAEFDARRASWAAEYRPSGEAGDWALDRAVAASFRIEECERAYDANRVAHSGRARLAWDLDRRADAAEVGSRLARSPAQAVTRLETTLYGCELLMGYWDRLGAGLDDGDWTEEEASTALDLLGVPAGLRRGRTPIDPPDDGPDPADFRRDLAASEFRRLASIREDLLPLDALQQGHAESGATALFTAPARLILRYERDAWRRYHLAIRELKAAPAVAPPAQPPAPAPRVVPSPPSEADRRVPAPTRPAPRAASLDLAPIASGFSTVDFAITPTPRL